jgi:RNA polymerase sigma-70 factor (ECF subfamily)
VRYAPNPPKLVPVELSISTSSWNRDQAKQGSLMETLPRPRAFPTWDKEILGHLPALHRYALSLARNFHAAEDLVQDTVVKAYSRIDKFAPGSKLRAWLFTILRNTFYSGMRKHKREIADPDGVYAGMLVTMPEHFGRLAMTEFLKRFAQLSPEHRDIVTLVGVSGHSYDVAANMIGIPVGTAKSRLSRARVQLSETLDMRVGPMADRAT